MGARTALLYTYVQKKITRSGGLRKRVPLPPATAVPFSDKKKVKSHNAAAIVVSFPLSRTHTRTHTTQRWQNSMRNNKNKNDIGLLRQRVAHTLRHCSVEARTSVSHWQAPLQRWKSAEEQFAAATTTNKSCCPAVALRSPLPKRPLLPMTQRTTVNAD